jgi:16S rRNA (adenine1518-N6/adenine1519-N6)-dimethyltransferase
MGSRPSLVKPHEVPPKRRFGQHFLKDTAVADRILACLRPLPGDSFLEIGAGTGALSRRLASQVSDLVALEVDRDCLEPLRQVLAPFPSARVVRADILEVDLGELVSPYVASGRRVRVAGNLPYNIATAIIERLLGSHLPFKDFGFLVQLEVAQRITARPGTRAYGYFSVLCQHSAEVRMGLTVAPGSFRPRPKVTSAVVSLVPRALASQDRCELALQLVAKAAFSHRRKTIANSLDHAPGLAVRVQQLLSDAGVDPGRRAEELSVAEYERLAVCYVRLAAEAG